MKQNKQNFETSLKALEKLVSEMEAGNLSLDEMIKHFDEGKKLVAVCTEELKAVRARIEKVVTDSGETVPLEF